MGSLLVLGQGASRDMDKKELRAWKISPQLFDKILVDNADYVIKVDDMEPYLCGTRFKASIYYDNRNKLVVPEHLIIDGAEEWRQCICIRSEALTGAAYQQAITGGIAYRTFKNLMLKTYSSKDYERRLQLFSADYSTRLNQIHFEWQREAGVIYKYEHCVKYDMNGAYAFALIEIFPDAADDIMRLYREREIKPVNKDIINYYVGMLCKTGCRGTYNYIVQQVRRRMDYEIDYCGGVLLYANTDGFAVYDPEIPLATSKELGDFKLEYSGPINTYSGENYWIMQCGDKITGNVLYSVRDKIDLRQGRVVSYHKVKRGYTMVAEDIKVKEVDIIETGC